MTIKSKDEMRNYRRVWVRGHYRNTTIKTYEKGKLIDKRVRKWIEGYWRKIKLNLN
jgi:hypothetical protein